MQGLTRQSDGLIVKSIVASKASASLHPFRSALQLGWPEPKSTGIANDGSGAAAAVDQTHRPQGRFHFSELAIRTSDPPGATSSATLLAFCQTNASPLSKAHQ
eukprot:TRINITY_DN99191_c0_g1_i1.p2 TRINITY_DN99191_c0_g1~~TRINITY_DN99191_c0_g1_i1.p2  ORF type:complete len:103 (-),score=7.19 TRINITY_DN99191_c0_g1_i1:58-366(-)